MTNEKLRDGIDLTPFNEDFRHDPYPLYKNLRESDPVHKDAFSFFGERASWTITSEHAVDALLKDQRLSVDPRKVGLSRDPRAENIVTERAPDMMGLDEPDHTRLRGLVQKAFTRSSVENLRPRIEHIANQLLEPLKAVTEFDVVNSLAKPLPTIAIAELIGIDSRHHEDFKRWTDSLLLQGLLQPTPDQWQEIVAADEAFRQYMTDTIAQRRANPADDLVSRLIAAHDESHRLSDEEVVGMCILLIGAGNFTTTDLISNAVHALLCHSSERTDLSDIERVIEECLRFDSPVLMVRRYAIEDLRIDGNEIEQGSVVNLVLAAANHDPNRFESSETFQPGVSQPSHFAFGRGIHHCLGAPLARLETGIAIRALFNAFPEATLSRMTRSKTVGFRGFEELIISV